MVLLEDLRLGNVEQFSDPAGLSEAGEEDGAGNRHAQKDGKVAVAPVEFRHVIEVHALETGNRGRYRQDRRPAGELAVDRALARGFQALA